MKALVSVLVWVLMLPLAARAANQLVIVDHGNSDYRIVADMKQSESVREGARELQRLIEKATGVKLPIVAHLEPGAGEKAIVVGPNALAKAAGVTANDLPADGFHLLIKDANIYLVGKDADHLGFYTFNSNESSWAGSYFAVIEFARRFLDARWYMPGPMGEELPRRDVLAVPETLNLNIKPRFAIRFLDVTGHHTRQGVAELVKINEAKHVYFSADATTQATHWGRHLRLGNDYSLHVGHSWYRWMPADHPTKWSPKAYGKTHPEWYALVKGKRHNDYYLGHHGGQLCVSNAAMRAQFAQNIINYAKKTGARIFSISPNDGGPQCDGPNCRAWGYGTDPTQGHLTMTDRMIRFANDIARRVRAEVPDVTLCMYAYSSYTTVPTREKAGPGIILSDVYNFMPYRYHTPGKRQWMQTQMTGWRSRVSNIVLTTYYTGYGHYSMPWSTLDVQGWMMKLLAEYPSSTGLRMNYLHRSPPAMGMLGPDPWVLAHLMWDPNQSVKALAKQWYQGSFGPVAGPLVHEYFDAINQAMIQAIQQHHFTGVRDVKSYLVPAYSSVRTKCDKLIEQATAAAAEMPKRYQWRMDQIARGWKFAKLTLDAIAAANHARAVGGKAAFEKAAKLGQKRLGLAADPASVFALCPIAVEDMAERVNLGIIMKVPANTGERHQ